MAALTNETASGRVQLWLKQHLDVDLLISEWCITEFAAAISVKRRRGDVTDDEAREAKAYFQLMANVSVRVVPVITSHFRVAAANAENFATGLRAGDALHLALCASEKACLCTLDRRLAAAGPMLGITTLLL